MSMSETMNMQSHKGIVRGNITHLRMKLHVAKLEEKETLTENGTNHCVQDGEAAEVFEHRLQDLPMHHCGPDRG